MQVDNGTLHFTNDACISLMTLERIRGRNRLRALCRSLFGFLRDKLSHLILFRTSYFGSAADRARAKSLNRFTTRLYICLLMFVLTMLSIYTLVETRLVTKTIPNPTLLTAQQILVEHTDTAECPWSRISVAFNQLLSIQPSFHQVKKRVIEWLETIL